jgi:hypothetical protein
MKTKIFVIIFSLAIGSFYVTSAQDSGKKMASPPATAEGTIDGVQVKVSYHQPSARGRQIMGALVPFGKVWRTGANATTSIEFNQAVKIGGKSLAKGKYGLYTVPGENEWVIIINKTINWGAYEYKESEDLIRVNVKPSKTGAFVETFTISVEKDEVVLRWENTQVAFKISKG